MDLFAQGGMNWEGVGVVVAILMAGGIGGIVTADKIKARKNGGSTLRDSAADNAGIGIEVCEMKHAALDKRLDGMEKSMDRGFDRLQTSMDILLTR